MKVKGFVGLVGSVHFTYSEGTKKLSTYGLGTKGDIRFEVENHGRLETVSLTQAQLEEAVEHWLNRLDSQSTIEPLVLSVY